MNLDQFTKMSTTGLALVNYSDNSASSEDESEDENQTTSNLNLWKNKRKHSNGESSTSNSPNKITKLELKNSSSGSLPSVPTDILNMFKEKSTHQDDPAKHAGRIRSFAHEPGNWASLVYIPLEQSQIEDVTDLTQSMMQILKPYGDFHIFEDFHMSLSRTFILKHHWIDSMVNSLRDALENHHRFYCDVSSVEFYTNDEKTRTFIGLKAQTSKNKLKDVVSSIDSCLSEFRLEPYYKDPSFHISICWALGDLKSKIPEHIKHALQESLKEAMIEKPQIAMVNVNKLIVKTGNKFITIALASDR